jgi:hypothetical protein
LGLLPRKRLLLVIFLPLPISLVPHGILHIPELLSYVFGRAKHGYDEIEYKPVQ